MADSKQDLQWRTSWYAYRERERERERERKRKGGLR